MSSDEKAGSPVESDAYAADADVATPSASPGPDAAGPAHPTPAAKIVEPMTPSRSFWTRIDKPFVFGLLVTLGGLTAILLGLMLSNLSTVLIYIALAAFAALGLDPAVRALERRGLSRPWGVVIVILGLIAVIGLVLWLIVPIVVEQITQFFQSIPGTFNAFLASDFYARLEEQFGGSLNDLTAEVEKFLRDPSKLGPLLGGAAQVGGAAVQFGVSVASGISGAVVVLVLTLYFLAGMPGIKQSLLRLAPARDRARAGDITDQITDSVGGYVMGMVVLAFANSMFTLLMYSVLGLPFPPLMATLAFAITLIPLVGSVLFWIVGSSIALFSGDLTVTLIFAAAYLVYMQIEAYVLTPRVMNKAVSVPGSLVVIGAMAGGTLLGLLGALVAVPVAASILIIIKQVW
ncbi:MAG: AI-2E family transporter, partial [Microbacterium sp.]